MVESQFYADVRQKEGWVSLHPDFDAQPFYLGVWPSFRALDPLPGSSAFGQQKREYVKERRRRYRGQAWKWCTWPLSIFLSTFIFG